MLNPSLGTYSYVAMGNVFGLSGYSIFPPVKYHVSTGRIEESG